MSFFGFKGIDHFVNVVMELISLWGFKKVSVWKRKRQERTPISILLREVKMEAVTRTNPKCRVVTRHGRRVPEERKPRDGRKMDEGWFWGDETQGWLDGWLVGCLASRFLITENGLFTPRLVEFYERIEIAFEPEQKFIKYFRVPQKNPMLFFSPLTP